MKRRDFIIQSGILTSGTLLVGSNMLGSCSNNPGYKELGKHVIDKVEFGIVNYHWPRHVGRNSRIGVHGQYLQTRFVKLFTDQGAMGWAILANSFKMEMSDDLRKTVMGKTVDQLIDPDVGIFPEVERYFDHALQIWRERSSGCLSIKCWGHMDPLLQMSTVA